jgi:undecaprenyl diphosphate synthase
MITNKNVKVNHLGIIPDGSRRWAKKNNLTYYDAYVHAMKKLQHFIDIGFSSNIKIISLYGLSKENLNRPKSDLDAVFAAEHLFFSELLPPICKKWQCKVIHAGVLEGLPDFFCEGLTNLCESTSKEETRKLYLLVGYNPMDEIKQAIAKSKSIDFFEENLWIKEKIDLVIRTAYTCLLSNFAPLQSGYAELCFIQKLFNDMDENDYQNALQSYPSAGFTLKGK